MAWETPESSLTPIQRAQRRGGPIADQIRELAEALDFIGDSFMTAADRIIFNVTKQLNHGWNGSNLQDPVTVVSSDGAQWTLTLTGPGTSDLGCLFDGVEFTLDATPAVSVNLTAGTDTVPQANFIYLTESGGTITLNNSTSSYPSTAHIRVADCMLQSAASGATDGPYLDHQHSEQDAGWAAS